MEKENNKETQNKKKETENKKKKRKEMEEQDKNLEKLPKEAIMQILLNVEPMHLSDICMLNKRIQKVCNSNLFKKLHREKYYRFGTHLKEELYRIPDYLGINDSNSQIKNIQPKLTPKMRAIIVDWLFDMCETKQLNEDSFHYSVRLLDMCMSKMTEPLQRAEFQAFASACLDLAMRNKEKKSMHARQWIYWSDNAFTESKYIEMQNLVTVLFLTNNLKDMPTVMDYFVPVWKNIEENICSVESMQVKDENIKFCRLLELMCYYSLAVIAMDYTFIQYLPSEIVIGVILSVISVYTSEHDKKMSVVIRKYLNGYINDTNRENIMKVASTSAKLYVEPTIMTTVYHVDKRMLQGN